MLQAFGMAFKTPELRKKIFFTLSIMALFRFGSIVPTPGVDYQSLKRCLNNADTGGLFGLINLFSGGAFCSFQFSHSASCRTSPLNYCAALDRCYSSL
jgi:preprotein translocase subunit SecY